MNGDSPQRRVQAQSAGTKKKAPDPVLTEHFCTRLVLFLLEALTDKLSVASLFLILPENPLPNEAFTLSREAFRVFVGGFRDTTGIRLSGVSPSRVIFWLKNKGIVLKRNSKEHLRFVQDWEAKCSALLSTGSENQAQQPKLRTKKKKKKPKSEKESAQGHTPSQTNLIAVPVTTVAQARPNKTKTSRQRKNERLHYVQLAQICSNKGALQVTELNLPPYVPPREVLELTLTATNCSDGNVVEILSFGTKERAKNPQVLPQELAPSQSLIHPGQSLELKVTVRGDTYGVLRALLLIRFRQTHDASTGHWTEETIGRNLVLPISSPDLEALRGQDGPPRSPPLPLGLPTDVYHGEQPPAVPGATYERRLKQYPYSKKLDSMPLGALVHSALKSFEEGENDWLSLWELALHLEEFQMTRDIKKFQLQAAELLPLGKNSKLFRLAVPGLAEKRPSVLIGDSIQVRESENSNTLYVGYVQAVALEEITVSFHQRLVESHIKGKRYIVDFMLNRIPLRIMYRALEMCKRGEGGSYGMSFSPLLQGGLKRLLASPGHVEVVSQLSLPNLTFRNRLLNDLQQQAVRHILAAQSPEKPYIIFGPPGTGKTVTVVEAIQQLCRLHGDNVKILVCTPSNWAADLFITRLKSSHNAREMLRLYAYSRSVSEIDPIALSGGYANLDASGQFFVLPPRELVEKFQVVVTTCMMAGKLVGLGMTEHFSHIFMDESGQTMPPEALVPVSCLLRRPEQSSVKPRIVLAGDPRQLGPVIRSSYAKALGLGKSILEHLVEDGSSSYRGRSPHLITILRNNYRSHPAILKIASDMFYGSYLLPCADPVKRNAFMGWEKLPNPDFPVIFHGVIGRDERESNSPSYFNLQEVGIVQQYLAAILDYKTSRMQPSDVGIIAPYRKQVQKLKKAFGTKLPGVKIGSTEEFQGQERPVIIVSTCRSSVELMEFDARHDLGFLANPKRMNVSITRPQALLIVVGNPHVLARDPHWRRFLFYCLENGASTGSADLEFLRDGELEEAKEQEEVESAVALSRQGSSTSLGMETLISMLSDASIQELSTMPSEGSYVHVEDELSEWHNVM